ncbi:hypothetical protein BLNAU_17286 [Blattamonas nauphoetae]|uniref:Ubiquitin-like domain-containing protein n=1 Tax=Blattamonas nauphoetae TaxID=2049346 RepID=A0ABQ9X7L1_9EUKA|nr:hypothetical protein BLNAU_17286 [Blattamonas nauphoetae]
MEDAHPNIERMTQLLDRLGLILNKILDENAPINNRRVLFQALHSLSRSPSCDRNVKRRVDTLLPLLDDILDTNVVLVTQSFLDGLERQNQTLRDETARLHALLQRTEQEAEPSLNDVEGTFDLTVKSAADEKIFILNVQPQSTILQIKQRLVPHLTVLVEHITLRTVTEELSDSTTLAEINFEGHHALIAFVEEPRKDGPITISIRDTSNKLKELTISPSETIRELRKQVAKMYHVSPNDFGLIHLGSPLINPDNIIEREGIFDRSETYFRPFIRG